MRPAALMAVAASALSPPAKSKVSPALLPRVRLPVFKKVVLLLIWVLVPNSAKL